MTKEDGKITPTARTNAEVLATKQALDWLGNRPKGEKTKANIYNALMLRIQNAVNAYKPITDPIIAVQRQMQERYTTEAGADFKPLDNDRVTFGPTLDLEYDEEYRALTNAVSEGEPRRRAFTLVDFNTVGISVPQAIMAQLGPLLDVPAAESDPDALDEDEGENPVTDENA